MGEMKNRADARTATQRYNAAKRRAARLAGDDGSRLIRRLEAVSDVERYDVARDADRLTAYNEAVMKWQRSLAARLRATISVKSMAIAKDLKPNTYTDEYGIINRLGFSFPRHGIYIHKGAGRGQGGYIGSKWNKIKTINGIAVSTGIIRHTNPESLGKQDEGNRHAFRWFDPIVESRLPELADIVSEHFSAMVIDATKIYIDK
jgi:hypothetical protein